MMILSVPSAREELACSLGISRCSIASTGNAMALSDLKLNYFAPLKVRHDDDDPYAQMDADRSTCRWLISISI